MSVIQQTWQQWRHLTKLDPDKPITQEELAFIAASGTDALVVGGTQGINRTNLQHLWKQLAPFTLPKIQEVSSLDAIIPGADLYLIPMVLNSGDPYWLTGAHAEAIKSYGPFIPWDKLITEGYIILNPASAAAALTKAAPLRDEGDAAAFAACGEKILGLPVIYLEYSGIYGDPSLVKSVRKQLTKSRLFYGGGIDSPEKAREMGNYADTIIVGNMIYEGKLSALPATVAAVKKPRHLATKAAAN